MDINSSAQIPADKRIELDLDTPPLSAVPPLISADELSDASQVNTPTGRAIYEEIRAMMDLKAVENAESRPPKPSACSWP